MGTPAVPAREWREQVAMIHRMGKLHERLRKLEQLLDAQGKSLPPES
jgi:UDP-3-O-[3-hydroxymyristoyl] glucosamine N-acyltransferase